MTQETRASSALWMLTLLLGVQRKDLNDKEALHTDDRKIGIDVLNSKGSSDGAQPRLWRPVRPQTLLRQ